jgi:FixJ family two-component response regulator
MRDGFDAVSAIKQTVFVVDDDPAICESLCNLIESAGLDTVQFASAEEFLDAYSPELAGCLVLDVRLPGMSGMELQSRLHKADIAIPIIIMTAHGDIPMVRNAMKAGAVEFLTKPFQDEELLTAIEQAFARDRSQRTLKTLEKSIIERWRTLSERERQVLEMVTAGMLNKQIADALDLSLITVKLYRRQVMDKMEAETFADLVKMWERMKASRDGKISGVK